MTKEQIYQKEYRLKNKEKVKEYHKTYALNNKDKIAVYKKEHYKENKERIEIYRNNWRTIKSKNDSLFKLTNSIRTRIKQSFRRNGFTKKSKTFDKMEGEKSIVHGIIHIFHII